MTEVQMSINEFEDAKRMAQFAINVYSASWSWLGDPQNVQVVAQKMGMTDQDEVLFTWFDNTVGDTCPNFIIFTDEKSKSIVLAIRGTFSLADVVGNFFLFQNIFIQFSEPKWRKLQSHHRAALLQSF